MSLPFKSSKLLLKFIQNLKEMAGRTVHLLKQRTKPHQGIKQRKVVSPLLPKLNSTIDTEMKEQQKQDHNPTKPKKVEPTFIGPLPNPKG
jgi:hypothetical protein